MNEQQRAADEVEVVGYTIFRVNVDLDEPEIVKPQPDWMQWPPVRRGPTIWWILRRPGPTRPLDSVICCRAAAFLHALPMQRSTDGGVSTPRARAASPHRPRKSGSRFSTNERTPSRWSSVSQSTSPSAC